MSIDPQGLANTCTVLAKPRWRYNPKERVITVTWNASVSMEQDDGTTTVLAAEHNAAEKVLYDLREQINEVGFDRLHRDLLGATDGEEGYSENERIIGTLMTALSKRFHKVTRVWWEGLSGADMVTIRGFPGKPEIIQCPEMVSKLKVRLSDSVAKLDNSDNESRETVRLCISGVRKHEYHFPAPPLTYVRPDRFVMLAVPMVLTSSTGGDDIRFEGNIRDLEHMAKRFTGTLDHVVTQGIEGAMSSTERCGPASGPISRRTMNTIIPTVVQVLVDEYRKQHNLPPLSRRSHTGQTSPQGDEPLYSAGIFPLLPTGHGVHSSPLFSRHLKGEGSRCQSPPQLWLADEPSVKVDNGILTLYISGCLTSTAPGVLASRWDQVPTTENLNGILDHTKDHWGNTFLHDWNYWGTEEARTELAHWLAEELSTAYYLLTVSGQLRGFADSEPVIKAAGSVGRWSHAISTMEIHWTPKRCESASSRP